MDTAYLTVSEVAAELEISPAGVYKLIQRGKLPAIRRSERGLRVSRLALTAYQRRLQSGFKPPAVVVQDATLDELRAAFERETGLSPEEWERRWGAGRIEDSPENMRLAILASGLLVSEQQNRSRAPASDSAPASARRSKR
jgi:excisionase family DNA binding protein